MIEQTVTENFDKDLLVGLRVDPTYDEPILHQVLRIAVYDEYHAYETYKKVLETFGDITPFSNIIQAEVNHYQALIPLLEKYQVPIPVNDWEGKIETPNSILEAAEVGVAAEIDNIKMYDNLIMYAGEYPDVLDTLFKLQAASYNNHLPALRAKVAELSSTPVNEQDIYNQFSSHNINDTMGKVNELGELMNKMASGQISQDELMKLFSNTSFSLIGGALVGAIGASVIPNLMKQEENTEEPVSGKEE